MVLSPSRRRASVSLLRVIFTSRRTPKNGRWRHLHRILLPGTLLTLVLLASLIPNQLVKGAARAQGLGRTRLGLVIMSVFGIFPLILRVFEFRALNVLWDSNAYGSIVWTLLGLHTLHIATDLADTLVLTALMFTRHGHMIRRFSDVNDNAVYWDFVVVSWLPIYALIYWFPRVVG